MSALPSEILSHKAISKLVAELAIKIDAMYFDDHGGTRTGAELVLVGIMRGAFYFTSDLSRELFTPHRVEFIRCISYVGTEQLSEVKVLVEQEMLLGLEGKDLLLVDTICDSGATLVVAKSALETINPRTMRTCALVTREASPKPDFFGFVAGSEFLVGYGLDMHDRYRHYPYIFAASEEKHGRLPQDLSMV